MKKLIFIIALFISTQAHAYCGGSTDEGLLDKADLIFQGTVISSKKSDVKFNHYHYKPNSVSTFQVDTLHKGNIKERYDVYYYSRENATPPGTGHLEAYESVFAPGEQMLIFARYDEVTEKYTNSYCGQSHVNIRMKKESSPLKEALEETEVVLLNSNPTLPLDKTIKSLFNIDLDDYDPYFIIRNKEGKLVIPMVDLLERKQFFSEAGWQDYQRFVSDMKSLLKGEVENFSRDIKVMSKLQERHSQQNKHFTKLQLCFGINDVFHCNDKEDSEPYILFFSTLSDGLIDSWSIDLQ